ncbi:hypothetical protein [Embleya scabrispora]|uniref:hypothetical protein n=1 Tax=Embleya scabrispora TaxID=159449 RepID=UPI00117E9F40|nr:hypothetical protein [Embleya scabrispora]
MNARTYRLWGVLACREDLPEAAFASVVEALTVPSRGAEHTDRWRRDALGAALAVLFARVREPALRAALIRAVTRETVADHVRESRLGVEDLPIITAAHRVWPALVVAVAGAGHVRVAANLLDALNDWDLDSVASYWDIRRRSGEPARPMPDELLDAILHRTLGPCARALADPGAPSCPMDWARATGPGSWREAAFGGSAWRALQGCPDRWPDLVAHPYLGRAVRHVLLAHADTEALDDALLEACLPVLTLPELARLPRPSVTQRERLGEIAERVRRHPRVRGIAADDVHVAVSECMRRGRLSSARILTDDAVPRLARDLAAVGDNARDLAVLCDRVARLPRPTVVVRAEEGRYGPGPELGWDQGRRVDALAHLATNPNTPRDAVAAVLEHLHPAELRALACADTAPAWLRAVAREQAPGDDTTVRLLTDDELDAHPDPAAVLASWLDRVGDDDHFRTVQHAVRQSRHCTPELLLRLPVDDALGQGAADTTAPLLIEVCGTDPARWADLSTALDRLPRRVALGTFLESLAVPSTSTSSPEPISSRGG